MLPSGGEAPTSKAGPSKDQRLSQQIQTPQGYAAMHGHRTPLTSRGQVTIGGDVSNKNDCRTRYLRELRLLQPPAVPIFVFLSWSIGVGGLFITKGCHPLLYGVHKMV